MTHEELRENLEAWAIGALRVPEAQEIERHLATCESCAAIARSLSLVPLAMQAGQSLETPSTFSRTRLLSTIRGGSASAAATQATAASADTAGVASGDQNAARGARIASWLGIAAALVLAAFLGWDGVRLRGRIADLTR